MLAIRMKGAAPLNSAESGFGGRTVSLERVDMPWENAGWLVYFTAPIVNPRTK